MSDYPITFVQNSTRPEAAYSERLPSIHTLLGSDMGNTNAYQQDMQHVEPCPTASNATRVPPHRVTKRRGNSKASTRRPSPLSRGSKAPEVISGSKAPEAVSGPSKTQKAESEAQSRAKFADDLGQLQMELCSDNTEVISEWTRLTSNNIPKRARQPFTCKKNGLLSTARHMIQDFKHEFKQQIRFAIERGDIAMANRIAGVLTHAGSRKRRNTEPEN